MLLSAAVSIIGFKYLSFIVGFGCKQDPRSNAKGPEQCFSPDPPISLHLPKAIGKVTHTDVVSVSSRSKHCALKRGTGMNGYHSHVPVTQARAWTFQL